jgi:hypothetical protein
LGNNEAQLRLIRELFAECESRNLRIWLLGGWGIDALLGRVSREHHDVDILAEESSKAALREAIEHIGGEFADKPVGWRFWRSGVRVDITFFSYAADGTPISDLKKDYPDVYPWPPGSFPDECNGRLPSLSCRAISWEAQYVAKAGYKDAFPDTDLRSKDDLDLETIRRHVPPEKRKELKKRWFAGIPREAAIGPGP